MSISRISTPLSCGFSSGTETASSIAYNQRCDAYSNKLAANYEKSGNYFVEVPSLTSKNGVLIKTEAPGVRDKVFAPVILKYDPTLLDLLRQRFPNEYGNAITVEDMLREMENRGVCIIDQSPKNGTAGLQVLVDTNKSPFDPNSARFLISTIIVAGSKK